METSSENEALLADVWQKIPPEEKADLVAEAQATAISTVAILLMFAWGTAVGLHQPWFLWGAFCVVPFLFQVASAKAWNVVRPRAIVEYTAARATAIFYAKQARGEALVPTLQFKGTLERESSGDISQEDEDFLMDNAQEKRGPVPVWVTLFPDSLVMFSEGPDGSKKEFACSVFEDLSVSPEAFDDNDLAQRRLGILLRTSDGAENRWTLKSRNASHLSACERKLQNAIEKRNFLLEQASHAKQNAIREEIQAALAG